MSWLRLESMGRSTGFDEGVQAKIADPLWMIGRQWQVGELRGDDAARPVVARLRVGRARLATFRPGPAGEARPLDDRAPLEELVEAAPLPDEGLGGAYHAAALGHGLARRLRRSGLGVAVDLLRQAFPVALTPDAASVGPAARLAASVVAGRAIDGWALSRASSAQLDAALVSLSGDDRRRVDDVLAAWSDDNRPNEDGSWLPERLEHRFAVGAPTDHGPLVLGADGHPGGRLDWFSFDVDHGAGRTGPASDLEETTRAAVPTNVRYAGMPASRWWEFENAAVHFGDLTAGPGDVARLAVADFATMYGDDFFLIPLRCPTGALVRVLRLDVLDAFGAITPIAPSALLDQRRAPRSARPFRLFELHGDRWADDGRAPWLFLPPVLASTLEGPVLERVAVGRDEGANLAWAVERLVEGPLGRALDRAHAFHTSRPLPPHESDPTAGRDPPRRRDDGDGDGDRPADAFWRYRLEAPAPPWWIPLVPERIDPASPATRFRRARMQTWDVLDPASAGAKGTLLEPGQPFTLREEEVARSGVTVEVAWQLARWHDGSVHTWLQRRRRPGTANRSSGLRWDVLGPEDGVLSERRPGPD